MPLNKITKRDNSQSVIKRPTDSTTSTMSWQTNGQPSATSGQTDTSCGQTSTTSRQTNEETSTTSWQMSATSE